MGWAGVLCLGVTCMSIVPEKSSLLSLPPRILAVCLVITRRTLLAMAFPNVIISKAGLEACPNSSQLVGPSPLPQAMALPALGLHSWWQLTGTPSFKCSYPVPFRGKLWLLPRVYPPVTTTHPDIHGAVTCEIPAVQLPCSHNWGGTSHLFTQKKLCLIEAWQGLPGPNPEPSSPQLGDSGGNCLAPSGFRVPICEGVHGTPLTRSP